MNWWWLCAAAALVTGCPSDDFDVDNLPAHGPVRPNAHPGTGTTVRVGTTIVLDGSASFDPDGRLVLYAWSRVQAGPGSVAPIVDSGEMIATITPDVPGDYIFNLTVEDNEGQRDMERVTFLAVNARVDVNAGPDVDASWRTPVTLHGGYSLELPSTAEVSWRFVSWPADTAPPLEGGSTLTPSFRANDLGTYVLEMVVTADSVVSMDQVTVRVTADLKSLPLFLDPLWSAGLQRFVYLRTGGTILDVLDPTTGTADSIAVGAGAPAIGVALDPTGTRAAVAERDSLDLVDLVARETTATYSTPSGSQSLELDVVFGPNDRVHLFPHYDARTARTVDLATGTVTPTLMQVDLSRGAALRPSTSEVYTWGGSELIHWNGAATPVTPVRSLNYAAFEMFFSPSGELATSSGGSVIDLANLTIRGTLEGTALAHDPATSTLAVVVAPVFGIEDDYVLQFVDDASLQPRDQVSMPASVEYVYAMAFDAASAHLYAIIGDGSGLQLLTVPL